MLHNHKTAPTLQGLTARIPPKPQASIRINPKQPISSKIQNHKQAVELGVLTAEGTELRWKICC
jgi:hypothetical protein